jgi:two-component system chemotaxis response regulator CheY
MRILIADDQVIYRKALQSMLQPYGECVVVEDGEQAVQAFSEALHANRPFQLVLLDIDMPFMDGLEALVQIRLLEKKVHGPSLDSKEFACIIMQTNRDDPASFMNAFKKGHCNGFITKPVSREEVLEKMKKHGFV